MSSVRSLSSCYWPWASDSPGGRQVSSTCLGQALRQNGATGSWQGLDREAQSGLPSHTVETTLPGQTEYAGQLHAARGLQDHNR